MISEDEVQELVDMLFISRQVESLQCNKEERKLWMSKAGLSNKDYKGISMVFLGHQCNGTYGDISASCFSHVKFFLKNSTDKVVGCDLSCRFYFYLIDH